MLVHIMRVGLKGSIFQGWPILSCLDSRSDPIGGSEPVSGTRDSGLDSLPDFFLNRSGTCGYGPQLTIESKYHIHLPSPIYNYKTYFYFYKSEHGTYM